MRGVDSSLGYSPCVWHILNILVTYESHIAHHPAHNPGGRKGHHCAHNVPHHRGNRRIVPSSIRSSILSHRREQRFLAGISHHPSHLRDQEEQEVHPPTRFYRSEPRVLTAGTALMRQTRWSEERCRRWTQGGGVSLVRKGCYAS